MDTKTEILVVDDNIDLTMILQDTLKGEGYNVMVAHDGKTALAICQENRFDLALIDIKLPDMSGIELINKFGEISPETDYVIITAYADVKTAINAVGHRKIVGYQTKPLDMNNLLILTRQVSKQKQTEKSLQESEKQFRSIAETVIEGIYQVDAAGDFVFVNDTYAKILGYSPNELLGKNHHLIIPDESIEDTVIIVEATKAGQPQKGEFTLRHKLGHLVSAHFSMVAFERLGHEIGFTGIIQDITERKRAEEELRTKHSLIQMILATTPSSFILKDVNSVYLTVNRAFCEFIGKTEEEIIGKTDYDLFPADVAEQYIVGDKAVMSGGQQQKEEWQVPGTSGVIWMKVVKTPVHNEAGECNGVICSVTDISESKQAEEALRESEEKLRNIFENSTNVIYSHSVEHIVNYISPQIENLLGYTQEEAKKKWTEFASDNPINKIGYEHTIKAIETGKSQPVYELEFVHKSGKNVLVEVRESPVVKNGKTVSIVGAFSDITERKRAEEALRESEEKYRSLVESTEDSIYLLDRNCTYLFINKEHLSRLGLTAKKAIGRTYAGFHSEDDTRELVEEVEKVIETGKSTSYEYRNQRDGRYLIRTLSPVKDSDGKTISITVVSKNITFLKQAQEEIVKRQKYMESVVHSAPDAIVTLDASYSIVEWNPGAERIFGYSRDEVVGKDIDNLIGLPDMKHELKALTKKLLSGGMVIPFETVRYRKDGTPVNVIVAGSPIKIEDKFFGAVAVYTDITEVKKLQTQLLQAQKMEAIGILAGGVAHDLNNILSGIISYPELLLLDLPEDSPLRKPLLTIKSSGEKAAVVVQDLLTLARRGVTITEIVNLNSIISEQLKSPEYENLKSFHPNVDIKTNLEKDLLNIKGSTAHLSKTVMNLVSNAAEAMLYGGKIFISTENLYIDRPIRGYDQVEEGDYVVVTVSDTGIGISEEDIERIFEPFYTKKVMGRSGTGLGMAVVWGTVKDHNGYIDVESTKGKGTTFKLYFPITREELAIDKSLISIEDYMGKGESILIVDDVEEQREIASVMLKKLGYSVTSVSSGEEAIEYMKDNSVDLLVLDMIMDPGIDGLETYKRILKLHPKQKAIIASGFSETDRVKEAKRLGAGAYVKKPYVLEKIGLVIKEELDK